MNYRARPAWRNQWFAVSMIVLLFLSLTAMSVWVSASALDQHIIVAAMGFSWVLWLFLISPAILRRYSWRYVIDNENIESRFGIIARDLHSIRIDDLRNVNVKQSLWQRLFNLGDIEFSSAGSGGIEVVFAGIPDPMQVKALVQGLQDKTASRD